MASIIPGFEYDVFISYRQKDNKGDRWVTEFVNALKTELEATFKDDISIYFDENPHDGLHEHHDVDDSLREKLKCLVFIPILSRTYCDPRSFAFEHEFKAFAAQAMADAFGLKIKLPGGNVASRVLPVRIHELSREDVAQFETVTGSTLRAIDFAYREAGVNRALKPADNRNDNLNKTDYRNQVNKAANAISDLLTILKNPAAAGDVRAAPSTEGKPAERLPASRKRWPDLMPYLRRIRPSTTTLLAAALVVALGSLFFVHDKWQQEKRHAVEYIPVELKNPERQRSNWGVSATLSNDGRKIVYRSSRGWNIYDLMSGRTTLMPGNMGSSLQFDLSPNDDYAVMTTWSWMQQLYVLSLSTGQSKMITDSTLGSPRWTNSGWIYYRDLQDNIGKVDANGENRQLIIEREPTWEITGRIEVLSTGAVIYSKRIVGTVNPSEAELMVWEPKSRRSVALGKGVRAVHSDRFDILVVAQADGTLSAAKYAPRGGGKPGNFVKVLEGVETRGAGRHADASFNLSSNGDLLYITTDAISRDEMVWLDRKGRESNERLVMNGWVGGFVMSSDGQKILASINTNWGSASNLWLKNLRDGSEQKVSFGNTLDVAPRFVSAGAAITFVSPRDHQNWDLYRVALDGKSALEKILDQPGDIQDPDFAPGEDRVVFTERDIKGQQDVRVHHFGPEPRTVDVAATGANESAASFSPDGSFIVFLSNETGRSEVYVVPYPNPNKLRWQISAGGGSQPAWSHRGDELFYQTPEDELVSVKVKTEAAFSYGKPERLFSLSKLTWTRQITADDQNFILLQRDMRAPGRVILVKNWMQEVRRRLEGK